MSMTASSAFCGLLIGNILTTSFFIEGYVSYIIILTLSSLIMAFLGIRAESSILVTLTSFIGSYITVKGVSFFLGGFPNELEFHSKVYKGLITWDELGHMYYFYLVGIGALTTVCFGI